MVSDTNVVQSVAVSASADAMQSNHTLVENNGSKKASDNRRSNKPIMEKRRRARINNCLNELKTLILDAMKKDPARHSKLEKADILEMTVKHLRNVQRLQKMSAVADACVTSKFRAGYGECTNEISKYPGLDTCVKRRLLQHLTDCLTQNKEETQPLQVHILPSPPIEMQNIIIGNSGAGVQLVPTRLPNGDFALVLPTNAPSTSHRSPPLLVPIPSRTSSTASATSSSSSSSSSSLNYSPMPSPEPMELDHYNTHKPLSLIMRKSVIAQEEEQPWRPW